MGSPLMHLCAISKNNWQTKTRCLLSITALSITPSAKWPMFHLSLNSCWRNEMHPSLTFIMELKDNSKLPFLGIVIITNGPRLDMKVYVNHRYWAWCQVQTFSAEDITLNWAFKLSSNWQFFHQGYERLKNVSARLQLSWHCRREHHQTLYWHEDYWECMF